MTKFCDLSRDVRDYIFFNYPDWQFSIKIGYKTEHYKSPWWENLNKDKNKITELEVTFWKDAIECFKVKNSGVDSDKIYEEITSDIQSKLEVLKYDK